MRDAIHAHLAQSRVIGTLLIAHEGFNGSLSHTEKWVLEEAVRHTIDITGCGPLRTTYSSAADDNPVFYRLKVRVKDEIVNFGSELTKGDLTGQQVDWETWNELVDDEATLVLDVRNDYETQIGTFPRAKQAGTNHFRDLPQTFDIEALPKDQKVAMYCTGGIRCEKASNWFREHGFEHVYQLQGGILSYLASVPDGFNRWEGECFVFDQRVSVDSNLSQGRFEQCYACRRPISEVDKVSELYEVGVSCPKCFDETSDRRKQQFTERVRQESFAHDRGERHVGATQKTPASIS